MVLNLLNEMKWTNLFFFLLPLNLYACNESLSKSDLLDKGRIAFQCELNDNIRPLVTAVNELKWIKGN